MRFDEIFHGYERALKLQTFGELGSEPKVTSTQVIACFADIRGFTKFIQLTDKDLQDSIASHFLSSFFKIFPKAVLREAWDIEACDPDASTSIFNQSVRNLIFPTLAKKLGDGMLLVWEISQETKEEVRDGLKYAILDIMGYIQEYFYSLVNTTKRKNSHLDFEMELGLGLSSGRASKLDYGSPERIDYAGPPLNIAARLQDQARPCGIVVNASFASNHLLERFCVGEGEIKTLEGLSGIVEPIKVWKCESLLKLRRPRRLGHASLRDLKDLLVQPYVERSTRSSDDSPPLGFYPEDLKTLLEIREDREAFFARDAADHVRLSDSSKCAVLFKWIAEMESLAKSSRIKEFKNAGQYFHEAIASLGGSSEQSPERIEVVRSLHKWTTEKYPQDSLDLAEVIREHTNIATAISNGNSVAASDAMWDHLKQHHERVRKLVGFSSARLHAAGSSSSHTA